MKTGLFVSYDNTEFFYRVWNFVPGRKSIIIMHRGHEHSERLNEFATNALFEEYNIFSYDQRGNGHTPTPVSANFMDSVRDLDAFVKFIGSEYEVNEQDLYIVANSIAGVIVSAWVHDFAPRIAGMTLLAPAFEIKLYIPFAVEFITLGTLLNKNLTVTSYVKAKVLTHDSSQQAAYNADPLITKNINAQLLISLHHAGKRMVEDAAAIQTPTQILVAGKDYVVKQKAQKLFFIRIESETKEYIELDGFYHGLLFEENRLQVYGHVSRFIKQCFETTPVNPGIKRDKFSVDEYNSMRLNMIPVWQQVNFCFQKWALNKIGFLSKGMNLGLKYGFDSGISLDYVYRNQPQGMAGIGRLMDYYYLNAVGWCGIRVRKQHLLQLVYEQVERLKAKERPVKILDIAGGTGNYLFDVKMKYPDVEIVINDFKLSNIEAGEQRIRESGLSNMRFTNYDCFASDTYRKLNYQPNIILISGIFELFEDNELISKAISGSVSIAEQDSCLIYTGQPWHPQLKMIAYVLNSHKETDWIMRRRSQKELDRLFRLCGVNKENMLIDDAGIFTVSSGSIKSS